MVFLFQEMLRSWSQKYWYERCFLLASSLTLECLKDSRTLSEIYSDLRSPVVSPTDCLGNITARLLDFSDNLEGLGMRSTLYTYQRRSVAAMLQTELDPRDVPDPLYISARTIDGRDFYLQPGTMEILLQRPMTAPCKGGILCEELGKNWTISAFCRLNPRQVLGKRS